MASKRDLVEAHTFNRRRLVSAFVSGAPGGREVEPAALARPVVVGMVLAVLLVGGAAVTGFLKPTLPSGWEENTLVVAKESGARYLSREGTLYPVVNVTSARLLVPPDQFSVVFVPDEQLRDRPHGATLGILGAPESPPDPDLLLQDRWTSCVDQYGRTRLSITARPRVRALGRGASYYVRFGDDLSVVTGGRRYAVAGAGNTTLAALGLVNRNPAHVPGLWVDLFPAGSDLEPFTVPEAGRPVPGGISLPPGVRTLGTILETPDPDDGPQYYLVRRRGLVPMSTVAKDLYAIAAPAQLREPVRVDNSVLARNEVVRHTGTYPADWPSRVADPLSEEVVCAHLRTGVPGQELPEVSLVAPQETLVGSPASALVPDGENPVVVDAGRGAFVRSVSRGSNLGTDFLVDAQGTSYAVDDYAVGQLGYGSVLARSVAAPWFEFLAAGPELSWDELEASVAEINASGGLGGSGAQ